MGKVKHGQGQADVTLNQAIEDSKSAPGWLCL